MPAGKQSGLMCASAAETCFRSLPALLQRLRDIISKGLTNEKLLLDCLLVAHRPHSHCILYLPCLPVQRLRDIINKGLTNEELLSSFFWLAHQPLSRTAFLSSKQSPLTAPARHHQQGPDKRGAAAGRADGLGQGLAPNQAVRAWGGLKWFGSTEAADDPDTGCMERNGCTILSHGHRFNLYLFSVVGLVC